MLQTGDLPERRLSELAFGGCNECRILAVASNFLASTECSEPWVFSEAMITCAISWLL